MRAYTGEEPLQAPTLVEEIESVLPPESEDVFDLEPPPVAAPAIDRRMIMDAPVAEAPAPKVAPAPATPPIPAAVFPSEPAIDPQTAKAPPGAAEHFFPLDEPASAAPEPFELAAPAPLPEPEAATPEVKTVKVRSSVDVMAELEALRKRATNTTPKAPKRDVLADLDSLRPKKDISRTLHLPISGDALARTKTVRVTLTFEDGSEAVDTLEQQLEIGDGSEIQSLSVNLKIDLA
jgi:hypothetical protein